MTIPDEQREVVAFLTELARSAPNETHISAVFVGADTVWKLKKAVRLPFLDFTTVESRAYFLRRELELNGPWAPGLYRDVVGIERQADGTLAFGERDPIEFVLRMAKVPAADFMDKIAADGRLTPAMLDELGDCVAHCHQNLAPVGGVDFAAAMVRIAEGNAKSARAAGLDGVDTWSEHIRCAIAARSAWFSERSGNGFVRRCHGDLHLGNICLWQGHPVPFDALEFDEALATIDVGYDLAFLLMDLEHRADRAAANRVLNRYMARTGDVQATAGFSVFLSQRAMIRAHILAAMNQDAAGYVSAAERYLSPARPAVIAIGGLQGTGKSTVARALAPRLDPAPGALILRSDEIRKRLHNADPEQKLPPDAYLEAANNAVNDTLVSCARIAAQGGHSVIVDATFLDRTVRSRLSAAIELTGARFFGFWLRAPLAVLEARVASRGRDASDATVEVLRRAATADPGPGDWIEVDASGNETALAAVLDAIAAM